MVKWMMSPKFNDAMAENTAGVKSADARAGIAGADMDESVGNMNTSTRGVRELINPIREACHLLKQVGLMSDDTERAIMVCYTALSLGIGAYQIYLSIKAMYDMLTSTQWAAAAAETTAHAVAQDWVTIALAVATAAAVPIGLWAGYEIAHQENIRAEADRRTAAGNRQVTVTLQNNRPAAAAG